MGKVIYDECKMIMSEQKNAWLMWKVSLAQSTRQQATQKDMAMNKVEKPISAVIAASCGGLMAG